MDDGKGVGYIFQYLPTALCCTGLTDSTLNTHSTNILLLTLRMLGAAKRADAFRGNIETSDCTYFLYLGHVFV